MGRRVKLTESLLHRMINETIKEVINEATWKKVLITNGHKQNK